MPETFMKGGLEIFQAACIVVVKKTFRLADVFLYNHLYRNSISMNIILASGIESGNQNNKNA